MKFSCPKCGTTLVKDGKYICGYSGIITDWSTGSAKMLTPCMMDWKNVVPVVHHDQKKVGTETTEDEECSVLKNFSSQ